MWPLMGGNSGLTTAIAGDEEAGTLDLVPADPVRRVRLAASRWLAVLAAIVLVGVVLLVELAIRVPAEFGAISAVNVVAMTVQLVLFGFCFASIAFGIGGATGRRLYVIVGGAYLTQWTHCALLVGIGLCFTAAGIWRFNRRDLTQSA